MGERLGERLRERLEAGLGERLGKRLGKDWDAGGASHAMGEVRKKPNEIALRVGSKSADTN